MNITEQIQKHQADLFTAAATLVGYEESLKQLIVAYLSNHYKDSRVVNGITYAFANVYVGINLRSTINDYRLELPEFAETTFSYTVHYLYADNEKKLPKERREELAELRERAKKSKGRWEDRLFDSSSRKLQIVESLSYTANLAASLKSALQFKTRNK